MAIVVVGSVALDTIRTPGGFRRDVLGGSATHFSAAASFFAPVRLVAVVGEDFGDEKRRALEARGVDLAGLERVAGRTFRWSGEYGEDWSNPSTLETHLNVYARFEPKLPAGWEDPAVLFLANIDPELQARVLDRAQGAGLVAADTMNYWIASKPAALRRLLPRLDLLFLNEGEARQLTGKRSIADCAAAIRDAGTATVVVKRGEYGVLVLSGEDAFALPAYPFSQVVDPTGAGDSFAGGFLGFVASGGAGARSDYRRAAVCGSVMASFQVEDFSLERVLRLERAEIEERYRAFRRLTEFGDLREDPAPSGLP